MPIRDKMPRVVTPSSGKLIPVSYTHLDVYKRQGQYRKMHIPDDPAYYEKFYFTPGDLGFEPIETSVGRLGVLVCCCLLYTSTPLCNELLSKGKGTSKELAQQLVELAQDQQ